MKKYFAVFKWSFKMQIVWRFDVAMTMLATVGRIVAAWILWRAVYGNRELVSGFTFQGMLSYYVVSSFLSSLDMSSQISEEISGLIRDGGFSKHMAVPMSPFAFFSFMVAGEAAFHLWFSCIAAVFCALAFSISIALASDAALMLAAAIMIPLGLLCMMSVHYLLAMLAFKFLSVSSFLFAAQSLTAFLTGALVPLALLPESVAAIMRLFPFCYVTYLPAMLLTGRSGGEALPGIAVLACWTAGLLALGGLAYGKLRVRYEGVGI
ncbi:MAG: ABC-2 family transporter protein [Clostridiales bacterium]|jgi:ABC-2 type transport system permease protein|nr:ABC-2 family transporter protein [Clostridiales bacterium]